MIIKDWNAEAKMVLDRAIRNLNKAVKSNLRWDLKVGKGNGKENLESKAEFKNLCKSVRHLTRPSIWECRK